MMNNYRYVVLSHSPLVSNLNDLIRLIDLNLTYLERIRGFIATILKDFKTLGQLTSEGMRRLGIKEPVLSYLLTHATVIALVNNSQLMFRVVG